MGSAAAITPGEVVLAGFACAAVFIALVLAGIWAVGGFRRRR